MLKGEAVVAPTQARAGFSFPALSCAGSLPKDRTDARGATITRRGSGPVDTRFRPAEHERTEHHQETVIAMILAHAHGRAESAKSNATYAMQDAQESRHDLSNTETSVEKEKKTIQYCASKCAA